MRYEEGIRSAHRAERRNEQEAQRDRARGSHTANVQHQLHLADCGESGCVAHHGRVDTKTEDEDPEAVRRGKKCGAIEQCDDRVRVEIAPERANVIKLPIRNTTHTSRRLRPRDNRRREIPTVTDRSTIVTKAGYSKRSKARKIELNVFAYEEMTLALPRSIVTLLANGSASTIWVATQSATRAIATRRSRSSATVVR